MCHQLAIHTLLYAMEYLFKKKKKNEGIPRIDVMPGRLMGVNNTEVPLTVNWTIWWRKLHSQNASSSRFCSHTRTGQTAQTNSLPGAEFAKSTIPIHLFGGAGFSYGQHKTNNFNRRDWS